MVTATTQNNRNMFKFCCSSQNFLVVFIQPYIDSRFIHVDEPRSAQTCSQLPTRGRARGPRGYLFMLEVFGSKIANLHNPKVVRAGTKITNLGLR